MRKMRLDYCVLCTVYGNDLHGGYCTVFYSNILNIHNNIHAITILYMALDSDK